MKIHILTPGANCQKSLTFLFPIIFNERRLKDLGIDIFYFKTVEAALFDCDILIIDIEYFNYNIRWKTKRIKTEADRREIEVLEKEKIAQLAYCRDKFSPIILIDSTASTGHIETDVIPFVDLYCKGQLLKDRSLYRQRIIRKGRVFCQFYHNTFDIHDEDPDYSEPLTNEDISKLRIHWNTGLADHSLRRVHYRKLQNRAQLRPFFRYTKNFSAPSPNRSRDISCRISTHPGSSPTIRFQRVKVQQLLNHNTPTEMTSLSRYFKEMAVSKVAMSPFGFGEICYRDYEIFICGSLLFKADMSHLETFPDFYFAGKTYVNYQWDFSDFEKKIDAILSNYNQFVDIARAGQETYKKFITSEKGYGVFCRQFQELLKDAANKP